MYQVKMPKDVTFKPMAAMLGAVDGINGEHTTRAVRA